MPATIIIPVRYASTRFPGKPLYPLLGRPLIEHVYERVRRATRVQEVFVATDHKLIYTAVEAFGGKAIMTSDKHRSGTDRIAEAVIKIGDAGYKIQEDDIVVNVQGDEPLIMPEMVDDVVGVMEDARASIGTLVKRINAVNEITDPNIVKVAFNREGFALYFSRAPIPYHRDVTGDRGYTIHDIRMHRVNIFKHIGIYAYKRDTLMSFSRLAPSRLEEAEKLEQLRALENGFNIKVKETFFETIGVDTPEDLERVHKCLSTFS